MIITIEELKRRIAVFQRVLPGNVVDNCKWTTIEISRVMLKQVPTRSRLFNPSVETDKHDLQFELRKQFYDDIKRTAIAKAAKLRTQTAQLKQARIKCARTNSWAINDNYTHKLTDPI